MVASSQGRENPKAGRLRFQFGTRLLLILLTVICCLLAGPSIYRASVVARLGALNGLDIRTLDDRQRAEARRLASAITQELLIDEQGVSDYREYTTFYIWRNSKNGGLVILQSQLTRSSSRALPTRILLVGNSGIIQSKHEVRLPIRGKIAAAEFIEKPGISSELKIRILYGRPDVYEHTYTISGAKVSLQRATNRDGEEVLPY